MTNLVSYIFTFFKVIFFQVLICIFLTSCNDSYKEQSLHDVDIQASSKTENNNSIAPPTLSNFKSSVKGSYGDSSLPLYFPNVQTFGVTKFNLYPIETIPSNETIRVSFGVPFPRGYLINESNFRIVDINGKELPIISRVNLLWKADKTIRSVQVQLDLESSEDQSKKLLPKELILEWGVKRTLKSIPAIKDTDTFSLVDSQNFPANLEIYEPKAYAIFDPKWYGKSIIKNRLLPLNSHPSLSANDIAFKAFANTAINFVDPRVNEKN